MAGEAGYQTVRVAALTGPQPYPFPDPLYVNQGGSGSLSDDDTAQSLGAQLKALKEGIWIVVVHKVGDDSDPVYSVKEAVFASFCDALAAEVKSGRVRVVTLQ